MSKELSHREKLILQDAKEWVQGAGDLCKYCPINGEEGCDGESELCAAIGKLFDDYTGSYDVNSHPWDGDTK